MACRIVTGPTASLYEPWWQRVLVREAQPVVKAGIKTQRAPSVLLLWEVFSSGFVFVRDLSLRATGL